MTLSNGHPQSKLSEYADGELSREESRAVEEHLATCADCREEIAFIRAFDEGLAALPEDSFAPLARISHHSLAEKPPSVA